MKSKHLSMKIKVSCKKALNTIAKIEKIVLPLKPKMIKMVIRFQFL